jgi:hypothetical protein
MVVTQFEAFWDECWDSVFKHIIENLKRLYSHHIRQNITPVTETALSYNLVIDESSEFEAALIVSCFSAQGWIIMAEKRKSFHSG